MQWNMSSYRGTNVVSNGDQLPGANHFIFETDLPSWEKFQEARHTEAFRSRLRVDLRAAAKFSRTLRRWGFCAEDPWTREEADAASEAP